MGTTVNYTLSVDWEGHSLLRENLQSMQNFNLKFPEIPKIHFLNPAYYFTINSLSASEVTREILSTIGPRDELGLHIHPWEKFVQAAGVPFRSKPSYIFSGESQSYCGHRGGDVPLTAYDSGEIERLLSFGMEVLQKQGFSDIKYFRGGGWVGGTKIYPLLQKLKIFADCSPVPHELLASQYPGTLLMELAQKNWSHIDIFSQPQYLPDYRLWQYPNNLCLADYLDHISVLTLFRQIADHGETHGLRSLYLHFGWHQESAALSLKTEPPTPTSYLNSVILSLKLIAQECQKRNYDLRFPKLSSLQT